MPENEIIEPPVELLLEVHDWQIAFEPYASYPEAAVSLARLLTTIKGFLQSQSPDVRLARAALDQAVDTLFPLTEFHKGSYDLYRTFLEGRATTAHETLMESLGVRF